MDAELKRRDQNMEETLRVRDEEWKSRWEIRETELSEELKAREDAFISDQLRRYSELTKIMRKWRMPWRRTYCRRQMLLGVSTMNIRRK